MSETIFVKRSLFQHSNRTEEEEKRPLLSVRRPAPMEITGGEGDVEDALAVVIVPLTSQSHLAQLLHLSLLLCSRPGLAVHYASTATHVRQATSRLHPCWSSLCTSALSFHELPIPPFHSPPPDRSATKFPAHIQSVLNASENLRAPVGALLRSLSASYRRVVVVHDALTYFAAEEAAALPNVESYVFHCVAVAYQILFNCPSAALELSCELDLTLPPLESSITDEFKAFVLRNWNLSKTVPTAGLLLNTCRALEGKFLDMVAREPGYCGRKLFAIGPLSPLVVGGDGGDGGERVVSSHECFDWMDRQPSASVLYISFGTTTAMTEEQVTELAQGLLRSGQRFLWVLRDADRGDIFAAEGGEESWRMEVTEEWLEAVGERGMIVRGWAPQLDILAHRATGAFLSHCGWNSCMESIYLGVPMVAWPMHSDQPINAALVAEHHGVGVVVSVPAGGEVVGREEIAEAIKRVMVGEESEGVRRRARALGEAVRAAAADGGASRAALDAFVAHITG